MEEKLKKLIAKIKKSLKKIDNDDIRHSELNNIYEYCDEMEDVIYCSRDEEDVDFVGLDDDMD